MPSDVCRCVLAWTETREKLMPPAQHACVDVEDAVRIYIDTNIDIKLNRTVSHDCAFHCMGLYTKLI